MSQEQDEIKKDIKELEKLILIQKIKIRLNEIDDEIKKIKKKIKKNKIDLIYS